MARRKSKKKRKLPGHYCWRCGRRRANEKFSGKGHAKHICNECVTEQRAEQKRKRQIKRVPTLTTVSLVKKKVARVKKKRVAKKKYSPEKPVVRQRKFNFGS